MVTKQHFKNNIFVVLFEHSYSLLIVLNEKNLLFYFGDKDYLTEN